MQSSFVTIASMAQSIPVQQAPPAAAGTARSPAEGARELPRPIAMPSPRAAATSDSAQPPVTSAESNGISAESLGVSPYSRENQAAPASIATGPETPATEKSEKGGRSILRRMLPGGSRDNEKERPHSDASHSPRGAVLEGHGSLSPRRGDEEALSESMESMSVRRGSQSMTPSRSQQSSAARERKNSDAAAGSGIRLTAAALKDVDAKSRSEKPKGSGAGTTLRDMIMNAPKISRRGSNASHRSEGSGTSGQSSKSASKESKKKSVKGNAPGGEVTSLLKKYGTCERVCIGKGATAVVRIAHKWDETEEKVYAVKEFRRRGKNESEKEYVKKLTSEFCISSTLHHVNIVETVDLVQDENRHWCEVMEYCPGGDLYGAIKKGTLTQPQIESYFKQTIQGIHYLHSMGVAHRDIKPENLLLDNHGHVKITDFGVSDVFRMCWEKSTHYSKGLCGSEPYIAPEQFEQKEYDARLVDCLLYTSPSPRDS